VPRRRAVRVRQGDGAAHGYAEGLVVKGVDLNAERRVTNVARNITPPLAQIPAGSAGDLPGIVLARSWRCGWPRRSATP
jgi:hypothetical protein